MRITVLVVKVSPVLVNVYMAMVIILAMLGVDIPALDVILGHSLWMDFVLYEFSRRLRFCRWHRILIFNMMFSSSLSFFILLFPGLFSAWTVLYVLSLSLIVASVTSTILYFKHGCFKKE